MTTPRATTFTAPPEAVTLALRLEPTLELSDDQLFDFCQQNGDLRIERTATGELVVMTPAGSGTSNRNSEINMQLRQWAKGDGTGVAFDSSGGFFLPNGAMRGPDAAWVERERLRELTSSQRERFLYLCPTFVLELRSPTDSLTVLQAKMEEYREAGARLGWLIDPQERRVHVYRPEAEVEVLQEPSTVQGDPELPGFVLDLEEIWDPAW